MSQVLIIDDDESTCTMLVKLVRNIDHLAEYSLTLKEGLQKTMSGAFDTVFLDVNMPDGNGLEALKEIRKMSTPPEVIIITGEGNPDGAETAIKNDGLYSKTHLS